MAPPLKYTDEQLLDKARDFYKANNRVPGMNDFPRGLSLTISKRFGNWKTYLNRAIGKNPAYKLWQKDDLIKLAQEFWQKNKRFPMTDEIKYENRSIKNVIIRYFNSANEWFEESIGTSPRIEILRAIDELIATDVLDAINRFLKEYKNVKLELITVGVSCAER